MTIESTGSLQVTGGDILVGGGNNGNVGTINQNGGSLTSSSNLLIGRGNSDSRVGYFNLSGGTLNVANTSIGFNSGGGGGLGYFTQTGGNYTTGELNLAQTNKAGRAFFTAGGGSLTVADLLVGTKNTDTNTNRAAEFTVNGSSSTINVSGSFSSSGLIATAGPFTGSSVGRLTYNLDNGGVSTVNLTGSAAANLQGDLRAGFQAGAALTTTTSFALVEAGTGNITQSFNSVPSASLWDAPFVQSIVGGREVLALELAASASQGMLEADGENIQNLDFTSIADGYVALSGLTENWLVSVYLDASAGSQTIGDLIDYFNDNGLFAQSTSVGDYDVLLEFNAMQDGTSFFAWDLSSFDSSASLSGLGLSIVPEPSSTGVLALSLFALVTFRKRRY